MGLYITFGGTEVVRVHDPKHLYTWVGGNVGGGIFYGKHTPAQCVPATVTPAPAPLRPAPGCPHLGVSADVADQGQLVQ